MRVLAKSLAVVIGLFLSLSAQGAVQGGAFHESFMPENHLDKQITIKSTGGLNEKQFNAVIDKVESYYDSIVAQKGAKLTVERRWDDTTVNAYADQPSGSDWQVHMFGGLARRAEVTEDGFAMVVCHELGHHLGGFPYFGTMDWAADEGEADYHATIACAAKVFGMNMELSVKAETELPGAVKDLCAAHRSDALDTCYRTMLAAKSLADLLGALGGALPSFDTPDPAVVDTTFDDHPQAQCRLDTYMAGVLCGPAKWDYNVIPGKDLSDHSSPEAQAAAYAHSCSGTDYTTGSRPLCWFHPG